MTVFDTTLDTLFNDVNLSAVATYTPVAGGPSTIQVVVEHDVELVSVGDADVTDRRVVIGIRKSEIAAPGRGDTVLVGAVTYTVDSVVADDGISAQVAVH